MQFDNKVMPITERNLSFGRPFCGKGDLAVLNYDDLVELARLCARNSRIATSRDVADELWRVAKEYQAQAAKLGVLAELGTNRRCQIPCDDSRSSNLPRSMVHSPGHAAAR